MELLKCAHGCKSLGWNCTLVRGRENWGCENHSPTSTCDLDNVPSRQNMRETARGKKDLNFKKEKEKGREHVRSFTQPMRGSAY